MTHEQKTDLYLEMTDCKIKGFELRLACETMFRRYCIIHEVIDSCVLAKAEQYESGSPDPCAIERLTSRELKYGFVELTLYQTAWEMFEIDFRKVYHGREDD